MWPPSSGYLVMLPPSFMGLLLLSHQGGICWVARRVCLEGKVI